MWVRRPSQGWSLAVAARNRVAMYVWYVWYGRHTNITVANCNVNLSNRTVAVWYGTTTIIRILYHIMVPPPYHTNQPNIVGLFVQIFLYFHVVRR